MPQTPKTPSRRDSWPPTLVRLAPTIPKDYPSLDDIDEDPLTYFLTPAPDLEDDNEDDMTMMDFDAGIEDDSEREIVRSVSPSSLDGLNKSKSRSKSPPVPDLSDLATPDTDDEEEDYIRFAPQGFMIPFSLRDFAIDGLKSMAKSKSRPSKPSDNNVLLSPSLFPPTRGRAPVRPGGGRGRQRTTSYRHHRPQHVWREPSPDVWSIEEETEEELLSELGSSVGAVSDLEHDTEDETEEDAAATCPDKSGDVQAAKPKKKVRFLLPSLE